MSDVTERIYLPHPKELTPEQIKHIFGERRHEFAYVLSTLGTREHQPSLTQSTYQQGTPELAHADI